MDKAEKRRLKKLGKEVVEKRSEELRQHLASTNTERFASDAHLRNEIDIRKKEISLRNSDRVHSSDYIRDNFTVRPDEFNLNEDYPASMHHFWECRECGDFVPTNTTKILTCRCGNIVVDGLRCQFICRDEGCVRVVRLLGKVAKASKWWQFWS